MTLEAPFPWFGGKRRAAPAVWQAFGPSIPNYVEPFFGSGAVLLGRPGGPGKVETINDKDAYVCNFWRAVQAEPARLAALADWPVNEVDLHARRRWLLGQEDFRERLAADPHHYDVRIAAYWVWGLSAWIGNGWMCRDERLHPCLPAITKPGVGVHSPTRKKPKTNRSTGVHKHKDSGIAEAMAALSERLRHVRVCSGDWKRVLGDSTLGLDTGHGMTPTAVFLDPPYSHRLRDKRLYREDEEGIAEAVCAWAIAHGDDPRLRIALCGYEDEHAMPSGWRVHLWTNKGRNDKERIWFSPHCIGNEPLFAHVQEGRA